MTEVRREPDPRSTRLTDKPNRVNRIVREGKGLHRDSTHLERLATLKDPPLDLIAHTLLQ